MNTILTRLAAIQGAVTIENGFAYLPCGEAINLNETALEKLPIAVIEIDSGAIHQVSTNVAMRIIIIDADTEGGDAAKISEINGVAYYVHDYPAADDAESIDPGLIDDVIRQLPKDTCSTVGTRKQEIGAELRALGVRMEHSLSAFDGEGHAIINLATGEQVEEPSGMMIRLAEEWSVLEGPVVD